MEFEDHFFAMEGIDASIDTILGSYRDYLLTRLHEQESLISDIISNDVKEPTKYIAGYHGVYNAQELARCFDQVTGTITGKAYSTSADIVTDVDALIDEISASKDSAYVYLATLEAALAKESGATAEVMSTFANKVQSYIGNISFNNSAFYGYCVDLLSNGNLSVQDVFNQLNAATTNASAPQGDPFASTSLEMTGVNPFLATLGLVNVNGFGEALQAVPRAINKLRRIVNQYSFKLCAWLGKKIYKYGRSLISPIDISQNETACCNGFDNVYAYRKWEDAQQMPAIIHSIWEKCLTHVGELLVIPTYAATYYFRCPANATGQGATLELYLVYNLLNCEPWYNELKLDWAVAQQDIEAQVAMMKTILPVEPIDDTTQEKDMFRKLYYTKKCVYAAALSFNPSTYNMCNAFYKDSTHAKYVEGFNSSSTIPSNITNKVWYDELTYMPDDTILIQVIELLVAGIINPSNSDVFVPYQWRTSQLPAKYHIKTDKDNISAALVTLGGITIIAIVVALTVIGVKVRKSLATKAIAANRAYETAIYDKEVSDDQLKKMQKKATRANKLAGNFITPESVASASTHVDPTLSEILYRITGEAKNA